MKCLTILVISYFLTNLLAKVLRTFFAVICVKISVLMGVVWYLVSRGQPLLRAGEFSIACVSAPQAKTPCMNIG